MGTVTERLELLITAIAKGAANEIRSVGDASKETEASTTLLQRAQQKLGIEGMSTGTIMKTALAGGIAVGGAAIAKFASDGIDKFSDLTNEVDDLQRVMGGTAEDASRVSAAIRLSGVDSKGAENAFFQLAKRIGEGTETLDKFGATVVKNKDGTTNMTGTLLSVADAYKEIKDPGERAAFLMENFGRQGKAVGELLERSKAEIKGFFDEADKNHEIFSQADLDAGKDYRIAIRELSQTFEGLQVEVGSAVVPEITKLTEAVTDAVHIFDEGVTAAGHFGGALDSIAHGIPILGDLDKSAGGAGGALGFLKDKVESTLNPVKAAENGIGALGEVFGIGGDEAESFSDKQDKVKDATEKVANAISEHGKNSKEARDAERELAAASKDLKSDQDNVGDALQKVNDKLQTQSDKAAAATEKLLGLAEVHLGAEGALLRVASAQDSYNDALTAAAEAGGQDADKNRAVQQSSLDLASAVLAAAEAHGKEVEASSTATTAQERHQEGLKGTVAYLGFLSGGLDDTTKAHLQPYIDKLNDPAANSVHHAGVAVDGLGLVLGDLGAALGHLDALDGRTVTVNVVANKVGDAWHALGF